MSVYCIFLNFFSFVLGCPETKRVKKRISKLVLLSSVMINVNRNDADKNAKNHVQLFVWENCALKLRLIQKSLAYRRSYALDAVFVWRYDSILLLSLEWEIFVIVSELRDFCSNNIHFIEWCSMKIRALSESHFNMSIIAIKVEKFTVLLNYSNWFIEIDISHTIFRNYYWNKCHFSCLFAEKWFFTECTCTFQINVSTIHRMLIYLTNFSM